jgi:site-specific DNA recombinase
MSTTHTTDLSVFDSFAKGRKNMYRKTNNCVIYTRVSTKEQADTNFSLETQRKSCEQYAIKNGYSILGNFGGTYESAKTDERKEFNKMLSFVKKSSEKISCIFVYSVDRFSRSGSNAMYIADSLKKLGIIVFAVTQPADTTTSSGRLQQNIQFIFSEYDNQLRREKCMAGVKEKLLAGIWCVAPPRGYDIVRRNGKKEFLLNKEGKLLSRAFQWRAEGLCNEEVRKRLAEKGLKLNNQRVSDFLRNPFYCGLIVHTALEGKIVEGIQEKAVSKALFLKINGLIKDNRKQGYTINLENDNTPLKRFLKCEVCNKYLRAYKAYKNQAYYYKCSTIGCSCNKRADSIQEQFLGLLDTYQLNCNADTARLIALQMIATYNQLTTEQQADTEQLKNQLLEADKKLSRLKERFVLEEIDREMYEEYKPKFIAERNQITELLAKAGTGVSNLEKVVENVLTQATKLRATWDLGDYPTKQQLQFLVFPDGITYNRKNDECRTPRVNSVFLYMQQLQSILQKSKSGNTTSVEDVSALVENSGVEPLTSCMPCKRSTN